MKESTWIGMFAAASVAAFLVGFAGGSSETGQKVALSIKQRFSPAEAVASTPASGAEKLAHSAEATPAEAGDQQTSIILDFGESGTAPKAYISRPPHETVTVQNGRTGCMPGYQEERVNPPEGEDNEDFQYLTFVECRRANGGSTTNG